MSLLLEALTYDRGSDEPLSVLVILVVRVTLVIGAAWLVGRAVATASAAVLHRLWLWALAGTLLVPVVWALTPTWRMPLLILRVEGAFRPQPRVLTSGHADWADLLVAAWIVGALVGACYLLLGIVSARRLFRDSRPCDDAAWLDDLSAVAVEMNLARRVELRLTSRWLSPAVWSVWRVQVLLPECSRSWPRQQRQSVLRHELAHVVRRDCVTQIFAQLVCAVWWFHPLVWYAAGRLKVYGEQAADDVVLSRGVPRAAYAEQLLHIARFLGGSNLPATTVAMLQPSHLENRLRAILDARRNREPIDAYHSLVGLLMAATLMIPLATLTPSVVRAVPPPVDADPGRIDIYMKLRPHQPAVSAPSSLDTETLRMADPPGTSPAAVVPGVRKPLSVISPSPTPIDPPAGSTQLLPNWETGRDAVRLLPNHVPGTSRILLIERQDASQPPQ